MALHVHTSCGRSPSPLVQPFRTLSQSHYYRPLRSLRADRPTARFSVISSHGDLNVCAESIHLNRKY